MPRGRPPTPTERKRRTGNPGKRKLPDKATVVHLPAANGLPAPPPTLEDAGRAAWVRLWGAAQGWLSPLTDIDVLTRLCEAHDERAQVRADIAREGRYAPGRNESVITHPAVTQLRQLNAEIAKLESSLGFTPSDRSRLGLAEVERVSKLDKLQARQSRQAQVPNSSSAALQNGRARRSGVH